MGFSLFPKNERFFDLFSLSASNVRLGAEQLLNMVQDFTEVEDKAKKLRDVESEGDSITHNIIECLNSSFITPLDREDIRSLASDMDDIVDHLESVAQYLVIFELAESPEALRQFAKILESMAEEIQQVTGLVWNLANEKKIQQSIVRISDLENQGDALYNTVIADLFKGMCKDSLEIMKWKEVYDGLEAACDDCKEYTHVLGNVVIKNA